MPAATLKAREYALPAEKTEAVVALLRKVAAEFAPATFANSLGAEDMVLTDMILKNGIDLEIFLLDTGRLPTETYDLLAEVEKRYGMTLKVFYPKHDLVEEYVRTHGINAFYESVDLRKGCCHVRKVEPLGRALAGKKAWVTGLRAEQAATRQGLPLHEKNIGNGHGDIEKFNPLADWSEKDVWAYIAQHDVPYNKLHDKFYPSIGCAPCTRAVTPGEDIRSGRWWWEAPESKECGLHIKK